MWIKVDKTRGRGEEGERTRKCACVYKKIFKLDYVVIQVHSTGNEAKSVREFTVKQKNIFQRKCAKSEGIKKEKKSTKYS